MGSWVKVLSLGQQSRSAVGINVFQKKKIICIDKLVTDVYSKGAFVIYLEGGYDNFEARGHYLPLVQFRGASKIKSLIKFIFFF